MTHPPLRLRGRDCTRHRGRCPRNRPHSRTSSSRSLGAAPPPPLPSPRAAGLLAPAAGCLIASSGEKKRSASRLEAPAPPPSRCRRSHLRNKLHSHLPLHYPPHQTCTTPPGPPALMPIILKNLLSPPGLLCPHAAKS